jgi:uncharacterized protein YfaP (DUF2135 family)
MKSRMAAATRLITGGASLARVSYTFAHASMDAPPTGWHDATAGADERDAQVVGSIMLD